MKKFLFPFGDTHHFSILIDDYHAEHESLKPFYRYKPTVDSFSDILKFRKLFPVNRVVLSEVLSKQYENTFGTNSAADDKVNESINSILSEHTYTVTTGHQLNIFTGPLYSIYKIATTIKLAIATEKAYPQYKIVPVFWMATEDHDFDEINHFRIFGKTLKWEEPSGGPVGRINPSSLSKVLSELADILGEQQKEELFIMFNDFYSESKSLAEATRKIVHRLFGKYGLVVIDGDDRSLKQLFIPEMQDEITNGRTFDAVNETSLLLGENYKVQVHPREINLFYMTDNSRERIIKEDSGEYSINNTGLRFSESEILNCLTDYPERFSPNVVLRTIYQEKMLPNLAYVGGPGELNYWLQFIGAFDTMKIPFPAFVVRNCIMYIDANTLTKLDKLNLKPVDVFESVDNLSIRILEELGNFHPGTSEMIPRITGIYDEIAVSFDKFDPSLVPVVESEKQKSLNGLKVLEEKAKRALKKKNEILMNQLSGLKERLMPNDSLQERTDNFIPYYLNYKGDFINDLLEQVDPFVKDFIILTED